MLWPEYSITSSNYQTTGTILIITLSHSISQAQAQSHIFLLIPFKYNPFCKFIHPPHIFYCLQIIIMTPVLSGTVPQLSLFPFFWLFLFPPIVLLTVDQTVIHLNHGLFSSAILFLHFCFVLFFTFLTPFSHFSCSSSSTQTHIFGPVTSPPLSHGWLPTFHLLLSFERSQHSLRSEIKPNVLD